jgi:DNA-binding protein H-NS
MARSGALAQLDLDALSDEELEELQVQVTQKLTERVQNRVAALRTLSRRAGFELSLVKIGEELQRRGGGQRTSQTSRQDRRARAVSPKYRNPDNPAQEWSGRGHRPKWLQEQLAAGRQLSDLTIHTTTET